MADLWCLRWSMAAFRDIENGVSIDRQAEDELSIVTDPFGRRLVALYHFATDRCMIVAQTHSIGVLTLYAVIGGIFGWLAVAGFAVIPIVGIIH